MNYGQIRDFALQLIRQYTIAGTPYAPSYNDQQDYLNAIPNLLNDGLVYLATYYRPRDAFVVLDPEEAEDFGGYLRFPLPEDLLDTKSTGLFIPEQGSAAPNYVTGARFLLPDYVLVPKYVKDKMVLEYYRRPQLVTAAPADTDSIDAPVPEQMCLAYWIAAHLVMQDDAFTYASLYNEFQTKAEELASRQITAEVSYIQDAYGVPYSMEGAYV